MNVSMRPQWILAAAVCSGCVPPEDDGDDTDAGESTSAEYRAGSGAGSSAGSCSAGGAASSGSGKGSGSGSGSSSASQYCVDVMGMACTAGASSSCLTNTGASKSICCRCDITPSGEVVHTWQDCITGGGFPVP